MTGNFNVHLRGELLRVEATNESWFVECVNGPNGWAVHYQDGAVSETQYLDGLQAALTAFEAELTDHIGDTTAQRVAALPPWTDDYDGGD
jgi:hypothetical protein